MTQHAAVVPTSRLTAPPAVAMAAAVAAGMEPPYLASPHATTTPGAAARSGAEASSASSESSPAADGRASVRAIPRAVGKRDWPDWSPM